MSLGWSPSFLPAHTHSHTIPHTLSHKPTHTLTWEIEPHYFCLHAVVHTDTHLTTWYHGCCCTDTHTLTQSHTHSHMIIISRVWTDNHFSRVSFDELNAIIAVSTVKSNAPLSLFINRVSQLTINQFQWRSPPSPSVSWNFLHHHDHDHD